MRTGWLFLAILLAASTVPVSAAPQAQDSAYVAGTGRLSIYCGPEAATVVPEDWTTEEILANPEGWAFSGGPECAAGNVYNDVREVQGQERQGFAYGGAAHLFTSADADTLAIIATDDAVFGGSSAYLRLKATGEDGSIVAEGCGPQALILPQPYNHFPVWPPLPAYWWGFVDAVGIDDDLEVCFATTGMLHATWGA